MSPFFPERGFTAERVDSLIARIPRSLIPMALLTGIVVHLYRVFLLASPTITFGWISLFIAGAGEYVLLLSLTTVYLGNHPVRQWIWRVPLFLAAEWLVEAAAVAILIRIRFERIGSEQARAGDLSSIVMDRLIWHGAAIVTFSLVLAVVVQTVRYALLKHEHRDSTVIRIHDEREMEKAEEEIEAREAREGKH
ncbi:MAG: hypothetical protein ABI889_05665 [Gemmatimonadota bacterium]